LILDSSTIIAVICREAGYERLLDKIAAAQHLFIGAPTLAETELALTIKLGRDAGAVVEQFLTEAGVTVLSFSREHVSIFLEAFLRFGKGRHGARLNMGDCFSYATAKVAEQPLLFVGEDFTRTDLPAA
jgi:ribonuclease VapC